MSDICQISLLITMDQAQQVLYFSLITVCYGTGIMLYLASILFKRNNQKYILENVSLLLKIISLWIASQVQDSYIQNSLILWQLYAQTIKGRKNRIQPFFQLCQMIIHLFTIDSVIVDNYVVFLLNLAHIVIFLVLLLRQHKQEFQKQSEMTAKQISSSPLPSIDIRIPHCERQLVTNTTSTKRVLLPPNTLLLSEDLKIIKSEFDLSEIIKYSNDQNQALEILLNMKLNCLFEQTQCQLIFINSWAKQDEQRVFSIDKNEYLTHENTIAIINSKAYDGQYCYQIQFVKVPANLEDDINNSMELDMCRSLSHELGTNLNSILTYIKMALNDDKIETYLKWKYLDPIRINSEQLNLIVGTIRDYNLIVLKQFSLKLEEIDVEHEVRFILSLFNESIESKGIAIHFNFTLDSVILVNDKVRFRQVLFQLIQNAVKYTFQSSISVAIQNDYFNCSISITDNGIGMTEDECFNLNSLFVSGKFAKVSENSVGVGLGLGISNQLVKQMSGRNDSIQLTRLSKGCQFSFVIKNHQFDLSRELLRKASSGIKGSSQTIRIISANTYVEDQFRGATSKLSYFGKSQFQIISQSQHLLAPSSKKLVACQSQDYIKPGSEDEESEERIHPPAFSPKFQKSIVQCSLNSECCARVLIVDDEYFNIQCLKLIMSKYQSKCDHAYNGQEALQQVQRKKEKPCEKCGNKYYSLIFLDVNMPVMDGYQTVKELKRLMKIQEINKAWCVANTGFCDIDTKLKSYDSGMDFYLTKPLDQPQLREILTTMFPSKNF